MSDLAPGVYVTENDTPAYTASTPEQFTACYIQAHNQGPVVATLVNSWTEFATLYGNLVRGTTPTALQLAAYCHFMNNGGPAFFIRIVDPTAVTASIEIDDTATTPVATVQIGAANPGAWGNNISVVLTAGLDATHFDVQVFYGTSNKPVEVWNNVSMDPSDPEYIVEVINASSLSAGSNYIFVTDLGVGTVPVLSSTIVYQLGTGANSVSGTDGPVPTDSTFQASTAALDQIDMPLLINIPASAAATNTFGYNISVINAFIEYCQTGRSLPDAFLVIDPQQGLTVSAMQNYAANSSLSETSHAGAWYPWVAIGDPVSNKRGAVRLVPPGAFAVSQMTKTKPWVAPAGVQATLPVLSTERMLTSSDLGNLNSSNINAVRYLTSAGVVFWGTRTLSNQEILQYINVRRTLIYVESNVRDLLIFAAFQNNGPSLWNQITQRVAQFLDSLWAVGGLQGATSAQAYYVTCDASNNDPSTNTVNVALGVACQEPTEFIEVVVSQYDGGTSVTESVAPAPTA